MKRRDFVGAGLTVAATMSMAKPVAASAPRPNRTFSLKYAPHLGMFEKTAGADPVSQIDFMAAQGFTAMEDNDMANRAVAEQSRIAAAMARHNMTMGVFVAAKIGWSDPNLTSGDRAKREAFLADIRNSVEVAKRVNATWMTVVPGLVDPRLEMSYQTANVIESLRQAAAILEPHGFIIVIEPLNSLRDHPGQFLTRIPQAFLICQSVKSPSCKILFDMYHQQITEGNLIPNLDRAWSEVAYLQIGDNPGRKEPGTGEINYRNIFRHLREKGYRGVLGMEHGNSQPDKAGEQAVIDAYVLADS
jgi:hydroxypyruvate isomerase